MLATYNCITLVARCMRHARTLRYRFIVLLIIPCCILENKSRGYILITMVQLLERGTRLNLCGVIRRGCAEYKTLSTRD